MMRTTLSIDDELLRRAKQVAARTNRTLAAVIEDALRQALARRPESSPRQKVRLKTATGSGVQPGVDLDSSTSLHDIMES